MSSLKEDQIRNHKRTNTKNENLSILNKISIILMI